MWPRLGGLGGRSLDYDPGPMSARRGEGAFGRRAAAIAFAVAAVSLAASPATAPAARESLAASKSRVVTPPAALLDAGAAKKRKKKKPGPPAVTASSQVAFASGTTQAATASCTGKTHVTGGGFNVSPSFTPPGTGLRSVTSTSHPTGPTGWYAGGSAFSTPSASGSFTSHAQCESNSLGKLAQIVSQTVTLAPANSQTFTFNCPPGTHALSGGYAGDAIAGFLYQAQNFRIIPLQSRRISPTQWTVQASNSSFATAAATFSGYAVCERNAKGRTISEASVFSLLANDARTTADPACAGRKQHVVSGGFLISPNAVGSIPVTAIDEFQAASKGIWHLGLHEFVDVSLPAGSSVQTYAYCAPDTLPKRKGKR